MKGTTMRNEETIKRCKRVDAAIRKGKNGKTVNEICKEFGVSNPTYYIWRKEGKPSTVSKTNGKKKKVSSNGEDKSWQSKYLALKEEHVQLQLRCSKMEDKLFQFWQEENDLV
jgi:transposase-like protein